MTKTEGCGCKYYYQPMDSLSIINSMNIEKFRSLLYTQECDIDKLSELLLSSGSIDLCMELVIYCVDHYELTKSIGDTFVKYPEMTLKTFIRLMKERRIVVNEMCLIIISAGDIKIIKEMIDESYDICLTMYVLNFIENERFELLFYLLDKVIEESLIVDETIDDAFIRSACIKDYTTFVEVFNKLRNIHTPDNDVLKLIIGTCLGNGYCDHLEHILKLYNVDYTSNDLETLINCVCDNENNCLECIKLIEIMATITDDLLIKYYYHAWDRCNYPLMKQLVLYYGSRFLDIAGDIPERIKKEHYDEYNKCFIEIIKCGIWLRQLNPYDYIEYLGEHHISQLQNYPDIIKALYYRINKIKMERKFSDMIIKLN